ncbi:MAG: vWA domain-containing protein, partial [Woeseiaceae bacterium]
MRKLTWLLTLAIGLAGSQGQAQSDANSSVATDRQLLVIYDSSNSMWGELTDSSRKYEAGRNALTTFLGSDLGNRRIGFRAYGHRRESDCNDSELIVPFSDLDSARPQINEAVNDIRPTGKTPITLSLREALGDFAGQPGDVLLISDGIETCDIDPCELMQDWQMADVNIRVHVVGVGLTDVERIAMSCIADTSGGRYFDADSEDGLTVALDNASEAIDEVQNGSGTPEPGNKPYAFRIVATDDQERTYIAKGKLFKGDIELGEVGSHQRNVLEGPGDYRIEVGPLLSDGSIYKPAEKLFTLEGPGEITVNVPVIRPAIVTARFVENGEEHRGSFVTARQHDQEVFGFRAFDEALARPGSYEFLAEPNADNSLSLSEVLVEGEHTELLFDLVSTVNFYVRFILP